MIQKKDIINFFKKAGMLSLCTLSFAGCGNDAEEVTIESNVQNEQSSDLKTIVETKNNSKNNSVYFAFNAKKDTRPESLAVIKDSAQFLQQNPNVYLILTGHVDSVAVNPRVNYTVALDRAYRTKEQLVAQKIDAARIYIKATTKQDAGMEASQERRVDFTYSATLPKVGLCHTDIANKKIEKKSDCKKTSNKDSKNKVDKNGKNKVDKKKNCI